MSKIDKWIETESKLEAYPAEAAVRGGGVTGGEGMMCDC